MKYTNINKIASATTILQESFSGPGRIECYEGSCNFTVDTSKSSKCSDPCHTYTSSNPFEYSFYDVATVSGKIRHYPSLELCYYKHALDINTEDWWDPWGLKMDEGCSATCTGCTFYPTEIVSGPGSLQCMEGDCYNYTFGEPYNDCGMEIQDASEEWGEIYLLGHGSDDAHVFSGFNNITSTEPIMIGEDCTLDCSGCQFTKLRKSNRLGVKHHKWTNTVRYSNDN